MQPNIQSSTIYRFGETFHWGQTQQTPAPLARPLAPSQKSTHSPVPASKTHTAASVNGTSKVSASSFPGKSVPLKLSPAPKHTFKSGKWVHDEDEELRASIEEHGTDDWEKVASGVSTRSAQQCRDRWTLYLADGLNSNDLSNEEVELMKKLLPAYVRNRKKPWAKLAESFPNRYVFFISRVFERHFTSQIIHSYYRAHFFVVIGRRIDAHDFPRFSLFVATHFLYLIHLFPHISRTRF